MLVIINISVGKAQTAGTVKSDEFYKSAIEQIKRKHIREAIPLLQQAIVMNNDNLDARVLLAKCYMGQSQFEKAIKPSMEVIKADPKYKDPYYYIIGAYLNTGKPALALTYTDLAIKQFGDDQYFLMKKLGILDLLKHFPEGDDLAERLVRKYFGDVKVGNAVSSHYELEGDFYVNTRNLELAKKNYSLAIKINPENLDASQKRDKIYAGKSSKDLILAQLNERLEKDATSYDLLMHKLGVLQELKRYAEALDVLKTILKYYPGNPKALQLDKSLKMEAADFYHNTNSYELYKAILARDPANRDALNKIIGLAIENGETKQALYYVNLALKSSPGNVDLVMKKMDLEEQDRNYAEAARAVKVVYKARPTPVMKKHFQELKVMSGRYYLGQMQADSALVQFNEALTLDSLNLDAIKGKINAFSMLNDKIAVQQEIDYALLHFPDNKDLLIKKAAFLEEAGHPEKALNISRDLMKVLPDNKKVNTMYIDQQLSAAAEAMNGQDYDLAKPLLIDILARDKTNRLAFNYLINLLDATGDYNGALLYCDQALSIFPASREFLTKKVSILYNNKQFAASATLAKELKARYPYDKKYTTALFDALLANGKAYEVRNLKDSALAVYHDLLVQHPADSLASVYGANILLSDKHYEDALVVLDNALTARPNAESFLLLKARALESMKSYRNALSAATLLSSHHDKEAYKDYAEYLKSKVLHDQFGLYFLRTTFDGTNANPQPYNVATIEERHYFSKGSFAGRINFAGRQQGTGLEGEADLYYDHNGSTYSYAMVGFSNGVILPKVRLSYSIFKSISEGTEFELGGRYLLVDTIKSFSGVASVSQRAGNFLFNLRAYAINESKDFYTAFNLTTKYLVNKQDYINFIASAGTSPDDRSRLISFPHLVGLLSRSVGAGYQKTWGYCTTFGFTGVWTNQKISTTGFQNQYDLYFTLLRKF